MKKGPVENNDHISDDSDSKIRVMVVGTMPPPIGGTSVSLQNLVKTLRERPGVELILVETGGIRGAGFSAILRFFKVIIEIIKNASKVDVITLHVNLYGVALLGPFVIHVGRLYKKPVIVRRFNGRDHDILGGIKFRSVDWTVKNAALYLVQTRNNVKNAERMGIKHVNWFPTSRKKAPSEVCHELQSCQRLVFLSHIRSDKGIPEILSVASRLSSQVTIDLYGPFLYGMTEKDISGHQNVIYRGVVAPDDIIATLQQYDALLLPTYCIGEGYPGVILEAFSVGIPVIATEWGGIPEIVDETCGILVQPRDADDLYEAIQRLCCDNKLYRQLCEGALKRQEDFDLDAWTDQFIVYCRNQVDAV